MDVKQYYHSRRDSQARWSLVASRTYSPSWDLHTYTCMHFCVSTSEYNPVVDRVTSNCLLWKECDQRPRTILSSILQWPLCLMKTAFFCGNCSGCQLCLATSGLSLSQNDFSLPRNDLSVDHLSTSPIFLSPNHSWTYSLLKTLDLERLSVTDRWEGNSQHKPIVLDTDEEVDCRHDVISLLSDDENDDKCSANNDESDCFELASDITRYLCNFVGA